jgi:hypothetical protein
LSLIYELLLIQQKNISHLKSTAGVVPAISNEQWINELHRYESIVFAGIQYVISDYAVGPKSKDPQADSYTRLPMTAGEKQLCGMQKMTRSGGFANINVFGLAFITVIALIAIFIDLVILRFLLLLTYFRHALAPRIDRWMQDSILQLQRHAYEAEGLGHWTKLDSDMPVATNRAAFTDLPAEPLLIRMRTGLSQAPTLPESKGFASSIDKIELSPTKSSEHGFREHLRDGEPETDPEVLAAWASDSVPFYRRPEYVQRKE